MILIKRLLALFLAFFPVQLLATGVFEGFSYPFPIYSAAVLEKSVFLATAGGVRELSASGEEKLWTSEDGLEATEFYGVVSNGDALYAVSAMGLISRYSLSARKFQVVNRSFLSGNRMLVPGLVKIKDQVMVLGFTDRLAFIDLKTERSILSLEKIGPSRLEVLNPKAIEIKEDSIFVSLGSIVYTRKMNWDSLAFDFHLADPDSWTEYYRASGDSVLSMAFQGNVLKMRSVSGTFQFDVNGKETSACEGVCSIYLQGKPIKHQELYHEGKSLVQWVLTASEGSFLVGSRHLWFYSGNSLRSLTSGAYFSLDNVHGATVFPSGGILAYNDVNFTWSSGYWKEKQQYNTTPYVGTENVSHLLKTVVIDSAGYVLAGFWGGGFLLFADQGKTLIKWIDPYGSNCIETYLENYIVPRGVTEAPGGVGFLVSYWGTNAYGFAYIDRSGEVSCANKVGSHSFAGPLRAKENPETGEWNLFVSSGFSQSIDGNGALDVFTFPSPGRTGGSLENISKITYPSSANGYIIDMDFDRDDRLWVVTKRSLAYFEQGMDSVQAPHQIKAYNSTSLSSVRIDIQNRVWVGTSDQGIYLVEKEKKSPDSLKALNYQMREGLLSNQVYGLALDSKNGDLWVVQNKGVTRYSRRDLRDASSFMTDDSERPVLVYPNPFKPREHAYVNFDYVSEDADVFIYNRGGALIRSFRGDALLGGHVEWDGKDASGRLVAPGVYHYFVKKGSKKEKGKLLIVH